jgi:hypothetical protein
MSVVVHSVGGSVGAENLQKAVTDSIGKPWLGGRPEDQAIRGAGPRQQGENQGRNNQPQNNNRRGRRGG